MFSTNHNSDASRLPDAQTLPKPVEISNRHFIVRLRIAVTRTKQTSETDSNRNISEGVANFARLKRVAYHAAGPRQRNPFRNASPLLC